MRFDRISITNWIKSPRKPAKEIEKQQGSIDHKLFTKLVIS